MDAKRSLSKIARTVLTKDYKCISLNRKRGLDLEPSKWDPKENKILTLVYLKLCLFILLGIVTYWLVIKNIIVFIKS